MDKKNFFIFPESQNSINIDWYVYYDQLDLTTAKVKRITRRGDINKFQTIEERQAAAQQLIDKLSGTVSQVYFKWQPLMKHLRDALNEREPWQCERWHNTCVTMLGAYERYIKFSGGNINIPGYIAYMQKYRMFKNTTINRHVDLLRTLYGMLKKKGVVHSNPCDDVRKMKERRVHGQYFKAQDMDRIKELMAAQAPELLMPSKWIYYCFLRPDELRQLQMKAIDLVNGTVTVYSSDAKDAEQRVVYLPDEFWKELVTMKYYDYPSLHFAVGRDGYPCESQVPKNYLYKRMRKLLDALGYEKRTGVYFYSWKHTGNVQAMKAGVNLKDLQRQNGHSDIRTTSNYIERMVGEEPEQVKTLFPKF